MSERVECEQDKTTIDSESGELSREEHTTPPEALETSTGENQRSLIRCVHVIKLESRKYTRGR